MASIRLTANEQRFVTAMNNAAGSVGRLSATINNDLARAMRETDAISRNFQRGFGALGDKIQNVGQSMSTYITLPLTLAAGAALKAYGELDSLKKGLLSIEGTLPNVERRLVQLREAAKLPGLGFQEAIQGDVRLRSVGIAAETSLRILKEFGNANALTGGGKEQLSQIITQLTQMAAKGKVVAQDLKPIIEAAPSVATAIKQMFGTVDSEGIQNQLTAAGKSSADFINDLLVALEKTPRVAGGFKNAMENVKDSLFVAAAGFGEALNKSFGLEGMLNSMSEKLGQLTTWFQGLSPEVQKTIFVFTGLAAIIGPALVVVGGLIAAAGPAIAALGGLSLPLVAAGAIIVSFTSTVIRNWGMISEVLKDSGIWDAAVAIVKFTVGVIGEAFVLLFDALSGDWNSFGSRILTIVKRIYNTIIEVTFTFINELLNIIQSIAALFGGTNVVSRGIETVKGYLGRFTSQIKADVPEATNYLQKLNGQLSVLGKGGSDTGGGGKIGGAATHTPDPISNADYARRAIMQVADMKAISQPYLDAINKLVAPKIAKVTWADEMLAAADRLKKGLPKILSQIDLSAAGQTLEEQIRNNVAKRAELALKELQDKMGQMIAEFKLNAVVELGAGLGEAIGEAIAGGGFDLSKVFSNILSSLGDFMIRLGKELLAYGKLFEAAKLLFNANPIAGGIAMIVGGGIIKGIASSAFSQTPKFAQGGMVTGPMLAVMGDNASGREMALPWEKTGMFAQAIAAQMGGSGGGGMSMVEVKIKGEDLYAVLQMHNKRKGI